MLQQLNQYLRTGLSRTRNGQMTLRHEIDLISAYLAIFKIRMGERLSYHIDIDESAMNVFIPALLLQPVVENAIQHGLEPKVEGGCIDVSARIATDRLMVDVKDSGIGQQASWNSGTGLSNVRDRIKAFYRGKASFNFSCNDNGTHVQFDLPVTLSEAEVSL
jgi:LytS/YehU family sensor histidine kinase